MRSVRPADLALALVLAGTGILEVAVAGTEAERPGATAVVVLVAAGGMLLRSARPLLCLMVLVTLVVVAQVPATGLALTAVVVVGCLLALGSVGRHCPDRVSFPAVVATVALFIIGAAFTSRPWDVVIALLGCSTAWGVGRLLRREAEQSTHLRALAADLAAQREARAQEAVQAERIRIAREVHDSVAHTVSVMTLQVGGVRRQLDGTPERARERDVLLEVEGLGREAVAELHRVLGMLRSADPGGTGGGEDGLAPQPRLADVHQLATRVRSAGVPVEVRTEGTPRQLPAGIELAGYRVVQEALTNVLKHGEGAAARVTIDFGDDEVTLLVENEGPGTSGQGGNEVPGGHGLEGMRERVALYGGRLEAGLVPGSGSGSGFAVRVTMPVPSGPAA